jgi:xanthine dehydrogenase accessory factor
MRDQAAILAAWRAAGEEPSRAVVVRTFGSSPRRVGAGMLRAEDGRISGSVSGGCVEGATAEHMSAAIASGAMRVVRFGISDEQAWDVGLACGGTIDVLVQPRVPEAVVEALEVSAGSRPQGRAVVTVLPTGSPSAESGPSELGPEASLLDPLVVHEDGRLEGTLGDATEDAQLVEAAQLAMLRGTSEVVAVGEHQCFIETFVPRPRLVIVGAIEATVALVELAAQLGYETIVIEARPAFASPERFARADRLVVGWPDEVADEIGLGPGDALAALSHDPKFDDPALIEALQRGCRYVGAIGSRKTQRARRERLLDAGVSADQLERLHGPIGLDLGGREPAETALAIMAEIVATRYGASGRPMVERGAELPSRDPR